MKLLVFLIILAVIGGIYYLLYINGVIAMSSKKAIRFIGKDKGMKATFTSCEGQIKRVIKFPRSKRLTFVLNSELTKGQMNVVLMDDKRKQLFCLSAGDRVKSLDIEADKRYYLMFTFKGASGKYEFKYM